MQSDCEDKLPETVPVESVVRRPQNLSRSPDFTEGLVLFKARMILDGRYREYKEKIRLASEAEGHWGKAEMTAARDMGYLGIDDELRRINRAPAPNPEPVKVDAKLDLEEAYRKVNRSGLTRDDFVRPQAWTWYELWWDDDPKCKEKVVSAFIQNLITPIAKAKAAVEAPEEVEAEREIGNQREELERFIKERKGAQ